MSTVPQASTQISNLVPRMCIRVKPQCNYNVHVGVGLGTKFLMCHKMYNHTLEIKSLMTKYELLLDDNIMSNTVPSIGGWGGGERERELIS